MKHEQGKLVIHVGTGSSGHGHETSFLQVAAERLRLPMEWLAFVPSDTGAVPDGIGTAASWSMTLGGSSVRLAADAALGRACEIATEALAAGPVHFDDGSFRVRDTNHVLSWDDIFAADPAFSVEAAYQGRGETVSVGCHACEVEVDPITGAVSIKSYVVGLR